MNKFIKVLGIIILCFAGLALLASIVMMSVGAVRTGHMPNPGRINLVRGLGPLLVVFGIATLMQSLLFAGIGSIVVLLANAQRSAPIPIPAPAVPQKK